ncbi:hypothetical protein ACT009_17745 [Sphingomonas sp. Tas61C01]|uniref:hypothetical protein n=1 Tax=Sphingomonas sp. Tas61C01 TaxID=3458297 RepID=UPI00403E765B
MSIRKRDWDFKPTVDRFRDSLREAVGNQRTVGSAASVGSPHMLEEHRSVNTFFHFFRPSD